MRRVLLMLVPFAAFVGSAGCDPGECTLQLVYHSIEITDASGNPLEEVHLEVVHGPTGTVLDASDPDIARPGEYVIVTSNHVQGGPVKDGDELEVTGTIDGSSFTESYIVRTDEGPCHPVAIEGAPQIRLES